MPSKYVLPRPKNSYDSVWAARLVDTMQRALDDLSSPAKVDIVVSNVTAPAAFNAGTATAAQSAEALGQLMQALQTAGKIV